ncbi:MAG: dienelactone hydrolase [Desulforhopalus sp.]|jgi:dienelactone hydrolase
MHFRTKEIADIVWKEIKSTNGIDSKKQIDVVISWSSGGLAAYEMAKDKKEGLKGVILIAPATNSKVVTKIKTDNLNGNIDFKYLDSIRPDSLFTIPGFTGNLLASGLASQNWEVTHDVKGLVLLSDPEKDIYVDSKKVEKTLRSNTIPENFEFVNYRGAAHEIDNEKEEHRTANKIKLEDRVVKFLDKLFP